MLVSFELTMPNKGSWNGKWSGEDNKYYVIKSISKRFMNSQPHFENLLDKLTDNFYYSWGDGWGANVHVQIIDASTAKKRRKLSKGFCGYEWMITSILHYGIISTETDRKKLLI